MTIGRLIAVVGPSGVGKDSIMAGLAAAAPDIALVRRTITRAPDLGGEDYDAVTPAAFAQSVGDGAFCLHWQAHGLHYGIPAAVLADVCAGKQCLANLSRAVLIEAARVFPNLLVLNISASPEVLKVRLSARGRESTADIERRLVRTTMPLPEGLNIVEIVNDGTLDAAISTALDHLQAVRS